jgi:hypothetical protein
MTHANVGMSQNWINPTISNKEMAGFVFTGIVGGASNPTHFEWKPKVLSGYISIEWRIGGLI